jgi:hypothetical protein
MTTAFKTSKSTAFDTAKVPTDHPTSPPPALPELPYKNETVAYFDMSDVSSLTIINGNEVSGITDLSGSANDIYDVGANLPTTGSTQNSLNILNFGFFSSLGALPINTPINVPEVTIVVLANGVKDVNRDLTALGDFSGQEFFYMQYGPTSTRAIVENNPPSAPSISTATVDFKPTWNMHVSITTSSPSFDVIGANGSTQAAPTTVTQAPFLGQTLQIGSIVHSFLEDGIIGDMAEVIYWPRVLSASELTDVKNYFQNKWAVSL